MKMTNILPVMLFATILLASCGNNSTSGNKVTDTARANKTKADTSIVTGDQKNIKNDSVSGDPSSKGAADPNAKLPKK